MTRVLYSQKSETRTDNELLVRCVDFWRYDEGLAEETIDKYEQTLKRVQKDLPYLISLTNISLEDVVELKKIMIQRGVGSAGICSVVFALRKFLTYCRDIPKLDVIDPKEIRPAKLEKREVIYLTKEEMVKLCRVFNSRTITGLRMRTLVQLLLSTGMRISEALSLNKRDIDWKKMDAMIIGKGNKQRIIYFTEECLKWIHLYLLKRSDDHPALFVTIGKPRRWQRSDLSKQFRGYSKKAGVEKKITPHILRHTFATVMINNGCDIFHVKNLLGHSNIETTAKYYLGLDKDKTRQAHNKFLNLD